MKMMKNKVENKRIIVYYNLVEDVFEEKENEIKLDCEEIVENLSFLVFEFIISIFVVNRIYLNIVSIVVILVVVLFGLV